MAEIKLEKIEKSYGSTKVVHGIDLEINDKEFVVLVGPSGCGKSTTLRMVAGLEEISGGNLIIGDQTVNTVSPSDRGVAMVFQDYALYPHMTVYENMAFGLRLKKLSESEIDERVQEAARMLDLGPYLKRKPAALSGGQRQRVAMGRAVVKKAKVFLFDEPLSNLDAKLRAKMRAEIKRFHLNSKTTTVYVTHDQLEAMTLADTIVVMKDGVIEQSGTPLEVFDNPNSTFVATFIGSPSMNLSDIEWKREGERVVVKFKGVSTELPLPEDKAKLLPEGSGSATLGIRPSDIFISNKESCPSPDWIVEAEVLMVEALGKNAFVTFKIGENEFMGEVMGRDLPTEGGRVTVGLNLCHCHLFDQKSGRNLNI
ncbi:MAG: sn-glycerol-3-phosphate ABC transporter ATP-binding protein UgpC [Bacteriovoracaceae bacterium]|nr:sn-glycerol-3-phosphate ABC transporter ATP-binding protein UgpC [Bacteriovoracaceae bacterium]